MFTVSCSFQFSRELGSHKNHGHINHFKSVVGKDRLDFSSFSFSSHEKQLDALSLHLLDSIHKPIHFIPLRYNKFVCRSSLIPHAANAIPILKTALTSLTRLYNSSKGSLFVLQLVPALGVIAFALCCLEPLMRHSRTVFLHQNDNSWKKSNVHYVMTSYIQPLLLWFGASLICRALDPMVLPSEASQAVKQRLLNFVRSLSMVLALAYCLSNFIQQAQKLFGETSDSSDTRSMGFQFAGKAIYSAVWVASVSLFMELLGFSTQKWLTAGGLGTVILTLAGREIFTNFLSSVMIHATRPFVVNEWIQTKIEGYDVSGTVEHVGWWSPTIIRGDDREAVHIPNHKFTVNVVRNLTQKTHWRIKTHLAISHLDVKKINIIVADMRKVLSKNPQVEQQKLHRRVFLENVNPENQALLILVSCFVKTSHFEEYLCVKEAVLLDLLRVISHHRARLATPIRTVQKIYSDADFDNIPFSDTIFSRARAAAMNRSLLLIEPPYKINGDEKSKGPAQTMEEDKEVNPTASPASGSSTDTKAPLRSDSNLDDKITSTPSTSKSDSKLTETPSDSKSDPEPSTSIPDSKTNTKLTGTSASESNSETKISESTTSEKPQVTSGNSKGEGSEKFTSTQPSTTTRPTTLKENIVLGVALDDSRQMLPIEEEMAPSNTAEIKEMAPSINSNESSPSTRTDSKVGQPAEDQEKRDPYI